MSLPAGSRLGPYEIVAPLGAGGMGEVFRARDTRLGRTVAIKILRPELAGFTDGRARFEREARTIASLAHPHICTLHDVGEADRPNPAPSHESPAPSPVSVSYLVMELLEGETLAQRLAKGPLSVEDTLTYAIQIADALACAHAQGIVHRDLKPSNIMLARSGAARPGSPQAKLLDFGLARLRAEPVPGAADLTQPASPASQGVVLGTLPYMAPEQLEGRDADARTDLFAFGAVVYEMATGRRAFDAPSQAGLIGAILKSDPPPIATVNPAVPPALDRIVKVCLAKNPDERWSTAHDVLLLLKDIKADARSGAEPTAVSRGDRHGRTAWIVAAVALIAAAILAARAVWPRADAPLDFVSVLPAPDTTLTPGEAPQVSPDGRHMAFIATDKSGRTLLYVRTRGSLAVRPLPETDGATLPFWSPDSRQLGFFARGSLKTIGVSGGEPQTLASAPVPRGGTWSSEDVIVFVPYPNELPRRMPAAGGDATGVPVPESVDERRWFPSFLPDGRHYLYLGIDVTRRTATAIRIASLDSTETTELMRSGTSAVYAEPGYLIFRRENALAAQAFDARRLRLEGTPTVVADKVGVGPIGYQVLASASNDGALAYLEPDPGGHLVWFDRSGRRLGTLLEPGLYNSLCITPDGRRIVYDLADAQSNVDIWSIDLVRGVRSRLTFDASVDFYPVCAPNSEEVIFASLRSGPPKLFRQMLASPGSETPLPQPPVPTIPTDWSRDGRLLVYSAYDPKTSWDIWIMPLSGGGQPVAFAATDAEERNGRLSPDGRWMAYTFRQGETTEVYVQPLPAAGTKWQISRGGGRLPVWRPDGRELLYISPDNKLVAVDVTSTPSSFAVGAPRIAAETRVAGWEAASQGSSFAVTPDSQRFLVSHAGDAVRPITLVLNWTGALKK